MTQIAAHERLIVALDVPSKREAFELVEELDGLVSFFKVGLELLMLGGIEELVRELIRDKRVFLDLKLPGDIDETMRRAVHLSAEMGVTFLTLSASVGAHTIRVAREGRGAARQPSLLFVSALSSVDEGDYRAHNPRAETSFEDYVRERCDTALRSGCDGLIVSGDLIATLRAAYRDAIIVSPGIRPRGASTDDHKRLCSPGEAITLGADYLVVGRPIRNAPDRREAAAAIIAEIEEASAATAN